jgi:hypothetical protein
MSVPKRELGNERDIPGAPRILGKLFDGLRVGGHLCAPNLRADTWVRPYKATKVLNGPGAGPEIRGSRESRITPPAGPVRS